MPADARPPRTALALMVSPLAASAALWAGSIVQGLAAHRPSPDLAHPVASLLVELLAFEILGAPAAVAGVLLVVWPTVAMTRGRDRRTWWIVTGLSAIAGAVLLPTYLHLLDPRMTFNFFPGAGAAAGAAAGIVFWLIARTR